MKCLGGGFSTRKIGDYFDDVRVVFSLVLVFAGMVIVDPILLGFPGLGMRLSYFGVGFQGISEDAPGLFWGFGFYVYLFDSGNVSNLSIGPAFD